MSIIGPIFIFLAVTWSSVASAESLRCNGDIIEVGEAKVEVFRKCGEPSFKDSYCEKIPVRIKQTDGNYLLAETCENVDIWTYNPGKGQFWTSLYFSQGKLREMRYGDRVQ